MTTSIGAMLRREIPPSELIAAAQALDGIYDELWIVEDLPYAGGIAQLASILEATEHARIGHGIAPAPFRSPVALAMEWAALAEMYPDRLLCGLGHGVQDWMAQIGCRVSSPLTLLHESVDAVRSLLRGELYGHDGRYVQVDDVRLEFPPSVVPPVMAGVAGPRSLRLSGAHCDGTILAEGTGPEEVAAARHKIGEGQHTGQHHRITVFAAFFVETDQPFEPPVGIGGGWLAVGADVEQVTAKLSQLIGSGIDSLVLVPMSDSHRGQLDIASSQIVPALREFAG